MRRTGTDVGTLIDATLGGVQQVTTKQDEQINEVHGLYDRHMSSLRRTPGKTLATTGPGLGPVFTIHQLRFRESIGLVRMEGGGLVADLTTFPLPGAFFPPLDLTDPISPAIPPNYFPQYQLPDFPQLPFPPFTLSWTPQMILPLDPVDNNPDPVGDGADCVLAVAPNSMAFVFQRGSSIDDIGRIPFTVTITGTWPPLIIHAKGIPTGPASQGAFIGLNLIDSNIVDNQLLQNWEAFINNTALEPKTHDGRIDVNVSTGFKQLAKQDEIAVTAVVSPYTLSFGGALERYYFQNLGGTYPITQSTTLTIENTSEGDEEFTLETVDPVSTTTVSPASGTIPANSSVAVTVTVSNSGLGNDDYDTGSLLLTTVIGGGTATTPIPIRAISAFPAVMKYSTSAYGVEDMFNSSTYGDFGRRDTAWGGNFNQDIDVYIQGGQWKWHLIHHGTFPLQEAYGTIENMTFEAVTGHFICSSTISASADYWPGQVLIMDTNL